MLTVGYLRSYDLPEPSLRRAPLPPWLVPHINRFYLRDREPYAAATLPSTRTVAIGDRTWVMNQIALVFPHLRLVQILVWIEDFVFPVSRPIVEGLFPFDFAAAGVDGQPAGARSIFDLIDDAYVEATGYAGNLDDRRSTDLGSLVFAVPEFPTSAPDFPRARLAELAEFRGCTVRGSSYDLEVVGREACTPEVFGRVVAVCSVLARGRHLRKRLIEEISDSADRVLTGDQAPWLGVRRTSTIQADYILFRRELNGEGFLNRAATKTLLREIGTALQIPSSQLDDLASAMESLDSLSQSLFGLAIQDLQRRVGWYGLFFAGVSILFATFAVADLVDASSAARAWVALAAALVVTCGLALRVVLQRDRRD